MADNKKIQDEIPMNSPEYLKRFQCSFNPMYIKSNNTQRQKGAITSSSLAMSSYRASSQKHLSGSKRSSGFGSGLSSGSGQFFGFGYGIHLI